MTQFPTPAHLASWAGLCPGNAERAGKRCSGRTRKGDRYLRRILVQGAWAAARTKDCFLAGLFYRIAARRGMKKAALAVAPCILTIAWKIIHEGVEYREQGRDTFDRRHPPRTARILTQRLERIGFEVSIHRRPIDSVPLHDAVPSQVCGKCHAWRLASCIHRTPHPKRPYKKRKNTDSPAV